MDDEQTFDVVRELHPVRVTMGLSIVRTWTQRGVMVGASLALAMVLVAHIRPFSLAIPISIAAFVMSVATGAIIGIRHWPSCLDAARAADRHFNLKDRLTSALELQSRRGRFVELQLEDTRKAISRLTLARSGRSGMNVYESLLASATVFVLAILLIAGGVPKPANVEARPILESQRIRQAATVQLPSIVRSLDQSRAPDRQTNSTLKRLNARLAQLRASLLHSTNLRAALRSISLAQQSLQRLESGLRPISERTVAKLNRALARTQLLHGVRGEPQDANLAAKALAQIAKNLGRANPRTERRLASKLSTVAKATPKGSLQKALSQAASWLAHDNPKAAQKSLNRAAALLHRTAKIQATRAQLRSAGKQLDALKNAVSGLQKSNRFGISSGKPNRSSSSVAGVRSNQRNVKGSHLGLVPHKSRVNARQHNSQRFAVGKHSKARGGSTNRNANTNASSAVHAVGGHDATRNNSTARYVTVHVGGHEGAGIRSVQRIANGAPKHGPIQWYRPVILRYAQSAHAALDRSDIPPDLKSYVRRYFTVVSH